MKKALSTILTLLFLTQASAQIRMMGVTFNSTLSGLDVVRWNAQTGLELSRVPTTAEGAQAGSSVFDASTSQYYFRSPDQLHRVDFVSDTCLPLGAVPPRNSIEIDMSNGKTFGAMTKSVIDSLGNILQADAEIFQYNLQTGIDSFLGVVPDNNGFLLDASTFDANRGDYYFIGQGGTGQLQVVRVATRGTFGHAVVHVNQPGQFFFGLLYDNEYDRLYALCNNNLPGLARFQLFQMDRLTGALTWEADFPDFYGIQAGSLSFDQTTSSLVVRATDSTGQSLLHIYNTVQNTRSVGTVPYNVASEIEVDNTQFAGAKYRATPPPVAEMRVYPVPTRSLLYVDAPSDIVSYTVEGMQGQRVASGTDGKNIQVADLPTGMYIFKANLKSGEVAIAKFFKE